MIDQTQPNTISTGSDSAAYLSTARFDEQAVVKNTIALAIHAM
jgi:hypothetical protein